MPRPPDLAERVARIEEKMATRDEVDALRAEVALMRRSPWRWLGGPVLVAALAVGFTALVLIFAVRPGMMQ